MVRLAHSPIECGKCGFVGLCTSEGRCPDCLRRRRNAWRQKSKWISPRAGKEITCDRCGTCVKLRNDGGCPECCRTNKREAYRKNPGGKEPQRRWTQKMKTVFPDRWKQMSCRKARVVRLWWAAGDLTKEQLDTIYERDKGKCVYCSCDVPPSRRWDQPNGIDHIIPRAKGGKHTASNIVICCGTCNRLKATKELHSDGTFDIFTKIGA